MMAQEIHNRSDEQQQQGQQKALLYRNLCQA